jgi:predicted DNA-binding protein (MmcQ/YjbR family)
MAKPKRANDDVLKELRAFGLAYPGAHFKSPWPGHLDLAVNDKTFAYLSLEGQPLGVSCKLPRSSELALMLPFVKPAGYGLHKSGWVAASFEGHEPDVAMLKAWIDESYRAQAPKTLVKQLDADGGAAPAPAAKKKPAAIAKKKPAATKR